MRAWNVSVLGDAYHIVSSLGKDVLEAEKGDILISPGLNTDFVLNTDKWVGSCLGAVTAAAKVIFSELSYPRMELDIDTRVGVYNIWFEKDRVYIKAPKRKLNFTKTEIEIAGINILLHESTQNGGILFCQSSSLSDFDESYLTSIYYRESMDGLKGVFAAEVKESEVSFKSYPDMDKAELFLVFSEFLFVTGRLGQGEAVKCPNLDGTLSIFFDYGGSAVASIPNT